jgi:hypothetical protein
VPRQIAFVLRARPEIVRDLDRSTSVVMTRDLALLSKTVWGFGGSELGEESVQRGPVR